MGDFRSCPGVIRGTKAEKQQIAQTSQRRHLPPALLLWPCTTSTLSLAAVALVSLHSFSLQLCPWAVASLHVRVPSAPCLLPSAAAEELQDQELVEKPSQERALVASP